LDGRTKGIGNIHIAHMLSFYPETFTLAVNLAGFTILKIYTDNLPAITPAMAAVCRPGESKIEFPSEAIVKNRISAYLKNVYSIDEKRFDRPLLSVATLKKIRKKISFLFTRGRF